MTIDQILAQIQEDTAIWQSTIHGLDHWERVKENGLFVAQHNDADTAVVEYFSYLHDSQRWNEHEDPQHGPRAAIYAQKHREIIDLDDDQFGLLQKACSGHTHILPSGSTSINATLAACWDGDRLDIGRIGIEVDPNFLFSQFAKDLIT